MRGSCFPILREVTFGTDLRNLESKTCGYVRERLAIQDTACIIGLVQANYVQGDDGLTPPLSICWW